MSTQREALELLADERITVTADREARQIRRRQFAFPSVNAIPMTYGQSSGWLLLRSSSLLLSLALAGLLTYKLTRSPL